MMSLKKILKGCQATNLKNLKGVSHYEFQKALKRVSNELKKYCCNKLNIGEKNKGVSKCQIRIRKILLKEKNSNYKFQ